MPDTDDQLVTLRRLAAAKTLQVARALARGEQVPAADIDRVARLEQRIATLAQFQRLRDLSRQPGMQPTTDGSLVAGATPTAAKKRGSGAARAET